MQLASPAEWQGLFVGLTPGAPGPGLVGASLTTASEACPQNDGYLIAVRVGRRGRCVCVGVWVCVCVSGWVGGGVRTTLSTMCKCTYPQQMGASTINTMCSIMQVCI